MIKQWSWFNKLSLVLGFAFLYVPILLLVIYSFNESRLVTVWAGFSTKWYGALLQNDGIMNAAVVTMKVALISSTLATIFGTMAGFSMVRFGRFRGRTLFNGMIYAPLVMPEVITGLFHVLCGGGHSGAAQLVRSFHRRSRHGSRLHPVEDLFRHHLAGDFAGRFVGLAVVVHFIIGRFGDRQLYHRSGRDDLADENLFHGAPGRDAGN